MHDSSEDGYKIWRRRQTAPLLDCAAASLRRSHCFDATIMKISTVCDPNFPKEDALDKERFIERMLETENLTDELEDADASWLLDWGIGKLDEVLQGSGEEDTDANTAAAAAAAEAAVAAGSRVNALMAVMRKINRIVGSYADKSPQALARDLRGLYGLFDTAFRETGHAAQAAPDSTPQPEEPEAPPVDFEAAADHLSQLAPRQALEFLAQEFFPHS